MLEYIVKIVLGRGSEPGQALETPGSIPETDM